MNGLPYYKAYPRDFIEGTIGMPFETKCAYRVVLDLIYMQGGNLPDDGRYISGLLGCSLRKWASIREDLLASGKLQVSGAFLTNYRAIIELETLAKHQHKQRENATGARKNKSLEKPWLSHIEPEPDKEIEPKGSLSETDVSDAPQRPTSKRKGNYPETFESVWRDYPTDKLMSKADAFKAWSRLDEQDRAALAASIPAFKAYCTANPTYRPVHMVRYITSRRFDGFQPAACANPTAVDDRRWQSRLQLARNERTWSEAEWGPPPGAPDCQAPSHLLQPNDGRGWKVAA